MKRKLKIKTELGVSDICVPIKSGQEAREADFILRSSGEKFDDRFPWGPTQPYLLFLKGGEDWFYNQRPDSRVEITIPQLAELLGVEYPIKQKLFVTGNWYKRVNDDVIFRFNGKFGYEGEPCGPGFCGSRWSDGFSNIGWSGRFEPANEEEVRRRLSNEARRRYSDFIHFDVPVIVPDLNHVYFIGLKNNEILLFKDGVWEPERLIADLNEELPTLQELVDAARKEIAKTERRYPHWFEDDVVVPKFKTTYGREFSSEKEAIAHYVSQKVMEML